jgi:hypothetical protein
MQMSPRVDGVAADRMQEMVSDAAQRRAVKKAAASQGGYRRLADRYVRPDDRL